MLHPGFLEQTIFLPKSGAIGFCTEEDEDIVAGENFQRSKMNLQAKLLNGVVNFVGILLPLLEKILHCRLRKL